MESRDRLEITVGERDAEIVNALSHPRPRRLGGRRLADSRIQVPCQRFRARPRKTGIRRQRPAEQQAQVLDAVSSQREQRLIEEVLEQVVLPDVDDEGDVRPESRYV